MSAVIAEAFEKEITEGRTDAKPDVWQDWDKFVTAAETLQEEGAKLADIASHRRHGGHRRAGEEPRQSLWRLPQAVPQTQRGAVQKISACGVVLLALSLRLAAVPAASPIHHSPTSELCRQGCRCCPGRLGSESCLWRADRRPQHECARFARVREGRRRALACRAPCRFAAQWGIWWVLPFPNEGAHRRGGEKDFQRGAAASGIAPFQQHLRHDGL